MLIYLVFSFAHSPILSKLVGPKKVEAYTSVYKRLLFLTTSIFV